MSSPARTQTDEEELRVLLDGLHKLTEQPDVAASTVPVVQMQRHDDRLRMPDGAASVFVALPLTVCGSHPLILCLSLCTSNSHTQSGIRNRLSIASTWCVCVAALLGSGGGGHIQWGREPHTMRSE